MLGNGFQSKFPKLLGTSIARRVFKQWWNKHCRDPEAIFYEDLLLAKYSFKTFVFFLFWRLFPFRRSGIGNCVTNYDFNPKLIREDLFLWRLPQIHIMGLKVVYGDLYGWWEKQLPHLPRPKSNIAFKKSYQLRHFSSSVLRLYLKA